LEHCSVAGPLFSRRCFLEIKYKFGIEMLVKASISNTCVDLSLRKEAGKIEAQPPDRAPRGKTTKANQDVKDFAKKPNWDEHMVRARDTDGKTGARDRARMRPDMRMRLAFLVYIEAS